MKHKVIDGAKAPEIEASEHRRPPKYRIAIALVVELNDNADVIDITPCEGD